MKWKPRIYLMGEITDTLCGSLYRAATAYVSGGEGELEILINSPGGDIFAAVGLVDLCNSFFTTTSYVFGEASSAAAYVATCVNGKRFISRNSFWMFHNVKFSAGDVRGREGLQQARGYANIEDKVFENMRMRAGNAHTIELCRQGEVWLNADDAVAAGVADEVV